MDLILDEEHRLVQTGDQLLAVVLESLERLQEELQGETPAIRFLWNEDPSRLRPKEESALSDYVKRHLQRDLVQRAIVINREVEIRPAGPGVGERTDIIGASRTGGRPKARPPLGDYRGERLLEQGY